MPDWTNAARASSIVLFLCLLALGAMALAIVWGKRVSYEFYHRNLYRGAVAALVFGGWTVGRIAWILLQDAKDYPAYRAEVVLDVIFWFLIPPIWFFVEYFAFDCGAVPAPVDLDRHRENLRAYADYASKIWAALAALLLGVAAIMFQK